MYMTRREFLLASGAAAVTTAAGLVLPAWYGKVRSWCDRTGTPLLEPEAGVAVAEPEMVLYAEELFRPGEYQLHLGPPNEEAPLPTWREFLRAYFYDSWPGDKPNGDPEITRDHVLRYFRESDPDDDEEEVRSIDLDTKIDDDAAYENYRYDWWDRHSSVAQAYDYLSRVPFTEPGRDLIAVGGIEFEEEGGVFSDYRGVQVKDDASLSLLPHVLNRLGYNVGVQMA